MKSEVKELVQLACEILEEDGARLTSAMAKVLAQCRDALENNGFDHEEAVRLCETFQSPINATKS